ncbi:MAG: OmpA family protein [Thermomonas sp.]|uniref:OmpA family protein n=1 Tax=Thermomonas sp. TaxID=1971895 RepID=UPI001ECD41F1|nr:OmpA family protein [Thermomonas sp.]
MKTASLKFVVLGVCMAAFVSGCATYDAQGNVDDHARAKRGALIGAAIGTAAGLLTGDSAVERRQHAMVGAGIGALAGGAVGNYQDKQEAQLRRDTAGTGIDVSRDGDVIKLNLPDGVTFDFNKTDIKPQFYPALNTVAGTLRQYNQTIVEVSGHTDSIGSDAANQLVSERRAQSVASYLQAQGVQSQRFEVLGLGKRFPVADNSTDYGRSLNRRVEIRLLPLRS